jgi:hypothetical protein
VSISNDPREAERGVTYRKRGLYAIIGRTVLLSHKLQKSLKPEAERHASAEFVH